MFVAGQGSATRHGAYGACEPREASPAEVFLTRALMPNIDRSSSRKHKLDRYSEAFRKPHMPMSVEPPRRSEYLLRRLLALAEKRAFALSLKVGPVYQSKRVT
jgi:hypothetical protein